MQKSKKDVRSPKLSNNCNGVKSTIFPSAIGVQREVPSGKQYSGKLNANERNRTFWLGKFVNGEA